MGFTFAYLDLSWVVLLCFCYSLGLMGYGTVLNTNIYYYGRLTDGMTQIGQWLPVISRVVMRTLFGEEEQGDFNSLWNWNVVQNNGGFGC